VASVAFIWLAWKALVTAHFALPAGWVRVETQFVAVAVLGHVGLRAVAPRAAPQWSTPPLVVAEGETPKTRQATATKTPSSASSWTSRKLILGARSHGQSTPPLA
jgi:hypothetical protein